VGQAAPPEVLQKLTYLVIRHHSQIKRVDTVRAYTFGALYFVEVTLLQLFLNILNKPFVSVKSNPKCKSNWVSYPFSSTCCDKKQVDIELPEELPLKEAHAIGESLQIKIEKLPEVERAFVHLDYECDHKPEHSILFKLPNTEPW